MLTGSAVSHFQKVQIDLEGLIMSESEVLRQNLRRKEKQFSVQMIVTAIQLCKHIIKMFFKSE